MIQINDRARFETVIETALNAVQDNSRWTNAVRKAAAQIEENGEFMTYDADTETLLIWSQQSNSIYESNGVCQCTAYEKGFPCFHRAAARLMKNYLTKPEEAPAVDASNAPYLKQETGRKPQSYGSIRF